MAEKKVKWSVRAERELTDILNFYLERNGSNSYCLKLLEEIDRKVKLIKQFNFIGRISDDEEIRVTGIEHFQIFYSLTDDLIEGITVEVFDASPPINVRLGLQPHGLR